MLPASPGSWEEIRAYARDKTEIRREVAEGFGISAPEAKRLLLSILFGRSLPKWRQERPDVVGPTPPRLRRLCSELAHARLILTRGRQRRGESQLTTISRLIQAAEQSVMKQLETAMREGGFEVGTLVHDALILQRPDRRAPTDLGSGRPPADPDGGKIASIADAALAEISSRASWPLRMRASVMRI